MGVFWVNRRRAAALGGEGFLSEEAKIPSLGFLGPKVEGLGLRVSGLGLRVEGLGLRVEG